MTKHQRREIIEALAVAVDRRNLARHSQSLRGFARVGRMAAWLEEADGRVLSAAGGSLEKIVSAVLMRQLS